MPSPTLNPEPITIDPHIPLGKPHLIGTPITLEDITTVGKRKQTAKIRESV